MNVMMFSIALLLRPRAGGRRPLRALRPLVARPHRVAVAVGGSVFFRAAVAGLRLRRRPPRPADRPGHRAGLRRVGVGAPRARPARPPTSTPSRSSSRSCWSAACCRSGCWSATARRCSPPTASTAWSCGRVREGGLETVPAARLAAGDELVDRARRPRAGRRDRRSAHPARSRSTGSPASRRCARWRRARTSRPGRSTPGAPRCASRPSRRSPPRACTTCSAARPATPPTRGRSAPRVWWHRLGTIYVVAVLALAALGLRRLAAARARAGAPGHRRDPGRHLPVRARPRDAAGRRADGGRPAARRRVPARAGLPRPGARRAHRAVRQDRHADARPARARRRRARQALAALPDDERAVLAAMAARTNHPASRALAAEVRGAAAGESPTGIDGLEETPGQGLEWRRGERAWRLGRPAFAVRRRGGARRRGVVRGGRPAARRLRLRRGDQARRRRRARGARRPRSRRARAVAATRRPGCGRWRPPSGCPPTAPRAA